MLGELHAHHHVVFVLVDKFEFYHVLMLVEVSQYICFLGKRVHVTFVSVFDNFNCNHLLRSIIDGLHHKPEASGPQERLKGEQIAKSDNFSVVGLIEFDGRNAGDS